MVLNNYHFCKKSYLLGFCCLIVAPHVVWTTKCGTEEYEVFHEGQEMCCKRCPDANPYNPCRNAFSLPEECRCNEGYVCQDKDCVGCVERPKCGENQRINKTGIKQYTYKCEYCPKGTYSEGNKGLCLPIQNRPTESYTTKNHLTTALTQTVVTEPVTSRDGYLVIVICSVMFFVLLSSICIHSLIWKARRTKHLHHKDTQPRRYTGVKSKEDGDSWSCQYPEEEHGEDTTEKPSIY